MKNTRQVVLGVALWAAVTLSLAAAAGGTADRRDARWVDQRIEAHSLKDAEVSLDQVAWAPNLPEALELARKHHRLVYLLIDRGDALKGRA